MSNLSEKEKIDRFPVTCYSRVVGWFAPVKSFNKGKAQEYKNRVLYKIDENKLSVVK